MQAERILAGDGLVPLCNLLEESQPALECLPEALLLAVRTR